MKPLLFVVVTLLTAGTVNAQSSPSTYFIDMHQTFSRQGDCYYQEFTVYDDITLDLRFASDYAADAAILPESEFGNFIGGGSYRGYGVFDNKFGTKPSIKIPAGRYYAAVRNETATSNTIRFEVDLSISLLDSYFYDTYASGADYVQANGKLWQEFTVDSNVRYFLDGCNSGVETYVIAKNQLANFLGGREFEYYADYGGEDDAYPGLWDLRLGPGQYVLVFRNQTSVPHAVTWEMERWLPWSWRASAESVKGDVALTPAPAKVERAGAGSAWLESGLLRVAFASRLDESTLSRSQFQITIGEKTVFPSALSYDASTGIVSLTAPELRSASGSVTASWTGVRTQKGIMSGSSDPLVLSPAPAGEPRLAVARARVSGLR